MNQAPSERLEAADLAAGSVTRLGREVGVVSASGQLRIWVGALARPSAAVAAARVAHDVDIRRTVT